MSAAKLAAALALITRLLQGETVESLLANRIDEAKRAVGIVVGTVDAEGRKVVTGYGKIRQDGIKPDGDTIFEIGSITKVFTSLLLADMVERGEVTYDTPISRLLPPGVKVPNRNGKEITLLDISMQVSGLPRMPSNFKPADKSNPYVDYNEKLLYEFISGYQLTRDPGEKYEYSNLAVGLLGTALARKAGTSYEALITKRILEPLGMKSTSITLTESQKRRLAMGHDRSLNPVHNWDLDALAGAGALRSTANDMLNFLAAKMEVTDSPLKPAMRRLRAQRRETGEPDLYIGMGWHIFTKYGTEIVGHNGATGGYHSFAAFIPEAKMGVVVLCNTSFDIDDIGLHVLEPQSPAPKLSAPKQRTEIKLPTEVLDGYVGEYKLAPIFSIVITREGDRLYLQATGAPKVPAYAEKLGEFYLTDVDAQISFVENGMVLHQNGRDTKGEKVR